LGPTNVFKRQAKVLVQYGAVAIGELRRKDHEYLFSYLPAFFNSDLKPLPDFPHPVRGKVYRNAHLWPFFANRIPDLRRDDVQEVIKESRLKKSDELELLVKLGRETINNPFYLTLAY
jgi:HipA-like protein